MFKKHLLGARLDQRLRTWVRKIPLVLENLLVEGREAHDLSTHLSGEGRRPEQGWRTGAGRIPSLSGG